MVKRHASALIPLFSTSLVIAVAVAAPDQEFVIDDGAVLGGDIIIEDAIGNEPVIEIEAEPVMDQSPAGAGNELVIDEPIIDATGGAEPVIVIEPDAATGGTGPVIVIEPDAATGVPAAADVELVVDEPVIDATGGAEPVIVIEPDTAPAATEVELVIEQPAIDSGPAAGPSDATVIEVAPEPAITTTPGEPAPAAALAHDDGFELRIDDAWFEYGRFTRSGSETDNALYGKLSAVAKWQPAPNWDVQLSGRIDGYNEDDRDSFTRIRADYGDSYVSYRSGTTRLTAGAQTVIWGRLDEIPLSDRVSSADLSRFILDDLPDRRRANPMLRLETAVGDGNLDVVWLVDFREAEMPDQDSVWYPINTRSGRIIGFDPNDVPPAAVQGATIVEDAPDGDGGFGARYTSVQSFADIGLTVARTKQSVPYFRADGPGRFVAEYPRSWAVGADAAIDAAGATWRFEVVHSSDNPVTRRDGTFTTTEALSFGAGAEFFPGDGDTRVNLQLVGMNMFNAPSVLDRSETYYLNGELEMPFDRERWRLDVDFNIGLDADDVYVNPQITFLGWEPHEVYAGVHYFDGDDNTFGGFHEDHSMINVGWRSAF